MPKKEETKKKSTSVAKSTKKVVDKKQVSAPVKEEVAVVEEKNVPVSVTENEKNFKEKGLDILGKFGVTPKKAGLILGVVVLLLFLVFASKNILSSGGEVTPDYPIVFVNDDDELMVMGPKQKSPVKVEGSYSSSAEVVYANKNTNLFLYAKNDSVYYFDVKKGESEKIANDIDDIVWSSDDKYLIYLNDDENLYSYNFKKNEKIDSDVETIYAVTDKFVVYEKDGSIYFKNFKSSKADRVKITSDGSFEIMSEDDTKVLYSEDNDYYLYNLKNEKKTKVISDASGVADYSKDLTEFIYVVKNDTSGIDISKILDDDKKDYDEKIKKCTLTDFYDDKCTYEEYSDYSSERYDIESRNDIREFVKEEYEGASSYDVYYAKNGKSTKIAENVSSLLAADYKTKRIVYTQTNLDSSKKLKISDYDYLSEFKSDLRDAFTSDVYYKQNTKKAYSIESNINIMSAYFDENDLYYVINNDKTNELYHGKISGDKVGKVKMIDEDLSGSSLRSGYKKGLVYGVDYSDKYGTVDLKIVKNGKVKEMAKDVYSASIKVSDLENKLYFLKDYDDGEGNLYVYDGKAKELASDINSFIYVNDKLIYVSKDRSSSGSKFDLYLLRGKKLTKISDDVVSLSRPSK